MAADITASLRAVGYGTDAQPWPIVGGNTIEGNAVYVLRTSESSRLW